MALSAGIREHLRQELCHPGRSPGNLRRVQRGALDAGVSENGDSCFHARRVRLPGGRSAAAHLRDALQTGTVDLTTIRSMWRPVCVCQGTEGKLSYINRTCSVPASCLCLCWPWSRGARTAVHQFS